MDSGRHRGVVEAGCDQLERDDLGQCILQGHPVRSEVRVTSPTLQLLVRRIP